MGKYRYKTAVKCGQLGFAKGSFLFLVLLAVGCSKPSNRGELSGSVTVDGVVAQEGSISFEAVDGMAPTTGGKIVDGQYSVQVPLGKAKVAIHVPKVVGEKKLYNTPNSPVQQIKRESLPSKYNDETELTVEITPGSNKHDFELSTK